jgi:hypothetical protein
VSFSSFETVDWWSFKIEEHAGIGNVLQGFQKTPRKVVRGEDLEWAKIDIPNSSCDREFSETI